MQIQCTNGTPIVDTLDHLPPLPLFINYRSSSRTMLPEQDESGIYHAIRLHDRVRHIELRLPPSILHKCLVLMDGPFPILEHLFLWSVADKFTTLTLPKAFLAPNLRHLEIPSISPPRRLRFLISSVSLVKLVLRNIQASSYFRPRLLVARIGSLPQLEELSIHFSAPIPRPSAEREMLGEQGTPITLPNLKILTFQGVSAYLESLVAQIRVPHLSQLIITLFNQIAFALPHLSHFVNITLGLKSPAMKVFFHYNTVGITTHLHEHFFLCVRCDHLDWQIDCAAQICAALIPTLSGIEHLTLDRFRQKLPTEWENGGIDAATWHELFRSFIGVKELHIDNVLTEELSRVLHVDGVGSDPWFLPGLQDIVAEDNLFASFIDTRGVVGRPVRFMPPPPPPKPMTVD